MTGFPNSPRVLKGGLVLIDPATAQVQGIISLQYNPERLTRTLTPQTAGGEAEGHSEAVRFKGPAVETIRLEADIDAADQLELPEQHRATVEHGIGPQLAALEGLVHPRSAQLLAVDAQASSGTLEIAPIEAPLVLFVWSASRIVPVRLTELSISEEAFDPSLNPLVAKVTLALRVLSVADLGFGHRGGGLFIGYLQAKERLAAMVETGRLATLGIREIG
ncbi:hypothetical protein Thimo_0787 [Thioflavicoccus mobilis 8321]|uniref:Uncharacterized protein n=1 Tax=Thioflavicoccus mobilis 8321 TaxID=765912 RepID=L0GUF5_9GAMM|nr:hypothetical protein [Thioflavicoccus mobilis]AGA89626.1 hypothetical protein Thimo_0787 [Thioflavicoccus mobilis 8321]